MAKKKEENIDEIATIAPIEANDSSDGSEQAMEANTQNVVTAEEAAVTKKTFVRTKKEEPKESVANAKEAKVEEKKSETTQPAETSKPTKKTATKVKPRGKKYKEVAELVDKQISYKLTEAIELTQKVSYSKFPATLEMHINTASKGIRGLVTLPYAAGKSLKVLAFGKGAEESGAEVVGTEETIDEILKGKRDFDVVVTTPEWMPKLAKAAKILGPRGLMPNPKSGTITQDLKKAVTEIQGGKTEYKTEANGKVIHLGIGKIDQPVEEISANVKVLYNIIGKSRIKKVTLAPTMGPGVKVDLSSI